MKQRLIRFCVFAFFLIPLLGWSENSESPNRPFRVNFAPADIQIDPQKAQTTLEAQLFTAFYEGLVAYDPRSLRPLPGAADSWSFSKDGKTLTFSLRAHLEFSDGEPLTSKNFLDTWLRLLNPQTRAPYASLLDLVEGVQEWREGKLTDSSKLGIKTPTPQTLILKLKEPAPQILSILSHYAFVPLPQAYLEDKQTFPASSGPYIVSHRTPEKWVLSKNPRYWDAANVKLEQMEFTFLDDEVSVTKAFKLGEFDWLAEGIDGSTSLGTRFISANALFGTAFIYIKSDSKPWNDPKIRKALWLSLPLEELRKNYLQPTTTLIPNFEDYPSPKGLEKQNKEEAQKLLKEAGFDKEKKLGTLKVVFPESAESSRIITLMKEAWAPLGVEIIEAPIKGSYYDRIGSVQHDIGYFSWIGDFLDPTTFLEMWKTGSSLNVFGFSSKEYDNLLVKASRQIGKDRLSTLADAENFLLSGALILPLSNTPGFALIDREAIGGWYANPLDIHPFKNLYWKTLMPLKNTVRFDF